MKLGAFIAFLSANLQHFDCLVPRARTDLQLLGKAELYIASAFNDTNVWECTLKLICEASGNFQQDQVSLSTYTILGNNQSEYEFMAGFGEMANGFSQIDEDSKKGLSMCI